MFDPLKIAVLEKRAGRPYYVINPADVYPVVMARFREIKAGDLPNEVDDVVHPEARNNWRRRIRRLPEEALDLALQPRDDFPEIPVTDAEKEVLKARAAALGVGWKYFKAVLRATGKVKTTGKNNVLSLHKLNSNPGGKCPYRD